MTMHALIAWAGRKICVMCFKVHWQLDTQPSGSAGTLRDGSMQTVCILSTIWLYSSNHMVVAAVHLYSSNHMVCTAATLS